MRAVTFDFWNTLVRDTGGIRQHRLDAFQRVLEQAGRSVDRGSLEAAFGRSWDAYVDRWKAGDTRFGSKESVAIILEGGGWRVTGDVVDELVRVFSDPPSGWRPPLTENVVACLQRLKSAEVAVGIICDVGITPGRTLRRYLAEHGVLDLFDHWSFSDEVGVFKPDPRIFTHALEGLSAAAGVTFTPADAAHIGDLRRTDIAGARSFGLTAIRYTGAFDDPGDAAAGTDTVEGHHVVSDHRFLPSVLGVDGVAPIPS